MKRLATILFFATVICLTTKDAVAQNVTYLDENYKPATAENYTYKRVIKYKEPLVNPNYIPVYKGTPIPLPTRSGWHACTMNDYYKTGERALVAIVHTPNTDCTQGTFEGQVVAYYKSGNRKRTEPWQGGVLNGVVVFYDEDGNVTNREEYVNGKRIDNGRFSAPADSPLLGTWKYGGRRAGETLNSGSLTITYAQSGVVEMTSEMSFTQPIRVKRNWRYVPKTVISGFEEDYIGDELMERYSIKWINRNQIERTVEYSQDPNKVGQTFILTRQ